VKDSYCDGGFATCRSPIEGALPKYLKLFVVSKVNFESVQVREPNPEELKKKKKKKKKK
jgi:hypothetical protein